MTLLLCNQICYKGKRSETETKFGREYCAVFQNARFCDSVRAATKTGFVGNRLVEAHIGRNGQRELQKHVISLQYSRSWLS
jgi:hypothetical protein